MAHFGGDVQGLSERQLDFISSVVKQHGNANAKVSIESLVNVNNVKRIVVDQDGKKFQMIVKVAPTSEVTRHLMNTALTCENERVMYTEVLKKFAELQNDANVPKSERFRFASCFGSLSEAPLELILLEDLQASNFVVSDKFKTLTDEKIKILLKNLAIFHSLSFVLKTQEPDTYVAFKNKLHNIWESVDQWASFFDQLEKDISALVDDKYKKVAAGAINQLLKQVKINTEIDKTSKYSVIQHGDSWIDNIMFKLNNGKPVECCLIDYHAACESNPVADVQFMIFNCTDYETRSKHYHDWIETYYSELNNSLSKFGLQADSIYPRDQLDADLKRYGILTFGQSSSMINVTMREPADAAKMKVIAEGEDLEEKYKWNFDQKTSQRIKEMLEGMIKSFLELGYF